MSLDKFKYRGRMGMAKQAIPLLSDLIEKRAKVDYGDEAYVLRRHDEPHVDYIERMRDEMPLPCTVSKDDKGYILKPADDTSARLNWEDWLEVFEQNILPLLDKDSWFEILGNEGVVELLEGKITKIDLQDPSPESVFELYRYVKNTMSIEDAPLYIQSPNILLQIQAKKLLGGFT